MSEAQVLQAANEAVAAGIPFVDRALASIYHGQSEHTWMANVVEAVEAILEKAACITRSTNLRPCASSIFGATPS